MPLFNSVSIYSQFVRRFVGSIYIESFVFVLNQPTITITALVTGNLTGHTITWEQVSGTPVTFTSPTNQLSVTFNQTPTADDKEFIFWIDKGTSYAVYQYVLVSAKPTDTAYLSFGGPAVVQGVGLNFNDFLGDQTYQVTTVALGPYAQEPSLFAGNAIIGSPTFTNWQLSFQPPTNTTYLNSFNILASNGSGYSTIISGVPYEVGSNPGFGPFQIGTTLRIDSVYDLGHAVVQSNPITLAFDSQQAIALDKISELGGQSTNSTFTTTFADYRISGTSGVDAILSLDGGVLGVTIANGAPTQTNSGGYSISTTSTYYEFINYSRVDEVVPADVISTIDFGVLSNVYAQAYTVSGTGIISLG